MFLERFSRLLGLKSKGIVGLILAILMIYTSIQPMFLTKIFEKDFSNDRVYCTDLFTKHDKQMKLTPYGMSIIELVISALDFVLFWVNKRRMNVYKR